MGSLTEIVLKFDFKVSTPDQVIGAFSALGLLDPFHDAPELPEPVVEAWEPFRPDWRAAGYVDGWRDPFEHEPWRHDWATWVSRSADGETAAHGLLSFSDQDRWSLDCRFAWDTDPETASEALAWLAPYADPGWRSRPLQVGHAFGATAQRPHLFLVDRGAWVLEDLNPAVAWAWA